MQIQHYEKNRCQLSLNPGGAGRFPHLDGHPERTRANAIGNRRGRVSSFLSRACAPLPEPSYWPLRPLFLASSDRGRQYDHDRRDTCERNAHDRGVVKLFLFFDRRPSFSTQGDVSSRLLCENPVVRDKNFRLVTSLALVSTARVSPRRCRSCACVCTPIVFLGQWVFPLTRRIPASFPLGADSQLTGNRHWQMRLSLAGGTGGRGRAP